MIGKVTLHLSETKGNASRFPFSSFLSFQCESPNRVRLLDVVQQNSDILGFLKFFVSLLFFFSHYTSIWIISITWNYFNEFFSQVFAKLIKNSLHY